MFVDLVDSTALVSGTDPEVARTRVRRFLEGVGGCVEAHGGTMGRYAGDSVMVAFGVPQTHEDDALRAVRAGLAILEHVRELELEARVGIESGEIVSDESDLTFATGEAINVAVRLQQAAGPGGAPHRPRRAPALARRDTDRGSGPIELRGIERKVWARRVVCSDEEPRPVSVAAPLVGRVEELDLLHNTFARVARDRRAHVFTLYGEPGVGKSRLAREFLGGGRRGHDPRRPRIAVRRGHHVLAGRRDGQGFRRDHRRRAGGGSRREAEGLLRGRGDRRPPRPRLGGARGGAEPSRASRRSRGPSASGRRSSPTCSRSSSCSRTSTGRRSRCSS